MSDPCRHPVSARFYLLVAAATTPLISCQLGSVQPSEAADGSTGPLGTGEGAPRGGSTSGGGGTGGGTGTNGGAAGGTGGGAAGTGTPPGNTTQTFDPTDFTHGYTYRGRFDFTDPAGPRYAWPNSAIGATFTGTSLSLKLNEPVPTTYNGTPVNNTYDVFVDNLPRQTISTTPGSNLYPVTTALAEGTHTMWLTKRTEANIGRGQFMGVSLSANAKLGTPPAAKSRFIEFIGDSSSSGYGNDGSFPVWNGCTFSVATADSTVAYPAVAANLLAADFHNIAFAGKGITRNLAPIDSLTMPRIYPLWDPRDTKAIYTFPGPPADVTVINVGGNDWTGDGPVAQPPDQALFVQGYIGLIQSVRSHSPKSSIFCGVTPLAHNQDRTSYIAYVKAVVAQAAAQGIADVQYFEFTEYFGALGFGCDGHPSPAASEQMAQQLVAAVRKAKGW